MSPGAPSASRAFGPGLARTAFTVDTRPSPFPRRAGAVYDPAIVGGPGRGATVKHRRQVPVLAMAVLVMIVAAGCASSGRPTAGPVAAKGSSTAPKSVEADLADAFDKDDPALEADLRDFYAEFNDAGDRYRVPSEDEAEDFSDLGGLADQAVVDYYNAWRAENEAYAADSPLRFASFASEANIASVEVDGRRATIRDCTLERRGARRGNVVAAYVTRVVTVANHGGTLRVAALDVAHEGRIDSPGYSCIPKALADRGVATVRDTIEAFTAARAAPTSSLPPALDKVVADPLQGELAASLAEQAAKGASITSPAKLDLRAVGLDPRGLGRQVAVVTACITYAEGVQVREQSTRKVVREVFPAGTVNKVDYAVRLDDADEPVTIGVLREKTSTAC